MGKALSKNNRLGLPVKNPFAAARGRRGYAWVPKVSTARFCPMGSRGQFARKALVVLMFSMGVETFAGDIAEGAATFSAPRLVSTKIFDAVTEKLPKYVAPKPVSDTDSKSSSGPDEGSEGTMKLPKITVRPTQAGPTTDAVFLTPKARIDLAMKAHRGLRIGNLFGSNQGIALFMQMEERELNAKDGLTDLVERTTSNDGAEAKEVRKILKKAIQRTNADWQNQPAGKSTGP